MKGTGRGDWSGVTAVVLAGGLGTRLRPVVGDRPKPIAEVGGRPFLSRIVEQVASVGIRHILVCSGHGAEEVERNAAWVASPPDPVLVAQVQELLEPLMAQQWRYRPARAEGSRP